jgi:hypothetical protein
MGSDNGTRLEDRLSRADEAMNAMLARFKPDKKLPFIIHKCRSAEPADGHRF